MTPLGPLETMECLTPSHFPGFTISHLTLGRPHSSMTSLCVDLCSHTIHLWTGPQGSQSNTPEPQAAGKEIEPEKRFISHFPYSGCRIFKDRHVEFVKRTKKTKNEDSDVGPELRGTEGLREAHSVHACRWLTSQRPACSLG